MVGNRAARSHRRNQKRLVCKCLHFCATYYKLAKYPPLGLEESPKPSGNTGVSENHCADPCAPFSNSEQLAAIISAMDRNELERRLLDLLKEIQPDTSE